METLIEIWNMVSLYLVPVMGVVTAATAITAITPTKSDDKVIDVILTVLNVLAGNVLNNKNADAVEDKVE